MKKSQEQAAMDPLRLNKLHKIHNWKKKLPTSPMLKTHATKLTEELLSLTTRSPNEATDEDGGGVEGAERVVERERMKIQPPTYQAQYDST